MYDTSLVYPLYYTDSYMPVYDRSKVYPDFLFIIILVYPAKK